MNLEELYRTYSPRLMKYALSILRNYHDAEDAVSECFLRLMRSEKRLNGVPPERRKAYLAAVLRNVCFTMLKNRGLLESEAKSEPAVPSAAETVELKTDLERALARFDKTSGNVLKLRFYGEYKTRDISSAIGLNENTVKIIIFRGKRQLKELLSEKSAC
ncbi:MAG: sigma-70 family RNA polymerase sigma factor [Bacteroides sp.]|nr:sigma-70 family RNA polymerase sigma factor [Eubacterium sp.]MCM1419682.1 sigma-70 family RNA polymerase sigma factor [Roseburia sp.]MCM1463671.1 sigma-70 family RNA polymerase sigma factor [Bacteroides sp.]